MENRVLLSITENENGNLEYIYGDTEEVSAVLAMAFVSGDDTGKTLFDIVGRAIAVAFGATNDIDSLSTIVEIKH